MKTDIRPIVIRYSMSSPHLRSNFPKSLTPGTIERPEPFACIIIIIMIKIESIRRNIERKDIGKIMKR